MRRAGKSDDDLVIQVQSLHYTLSEESYQQGSSQHEKWTSFLHKSGLMIIKWVKNVHTSSTEHYIK